ncbi:hypothetical protein E2C01_090158 [Portunus trituberculatus]|uniref:Uncharacterized protein n=1 Tax=Portunus trituberculatus TaxID=210409 RepID=A0A5B7JL37_PORTR|nr:hypothetical protein [Portunus trituberculatus]
METRHGIRVVNTWMGDSNKCRVIECSAKENLHIKEIFRTFLQIGKVPQGEDSSLKRQSSAYSKTRSTYRSQTPPSDREPIPEVSGVSGVSGGDGGGGGGGGCHVSCLVNGRGQWLIVSELMS